MRIEGASRQLGLFDVPPADDIASVTALVSNRENQWFDRKSNRIDARKLAECIIGFANADGGRIVVGIHSGEIEGISANLNHMSSLLQAGRDYAEPPVRTAVRYLDCTNKKGEADQLLVIDVEASEVIHRTSSGKCFLRVGDETRELGRTEERELAFDKNEAVFDHSPVVDLTKEDLDLDAIASYAQRVGATDINSLMRSRGIYRDKGSRAGVTQAGRLLFGLDLPIWSYIRYLRYDGTTAETGVRSNLQEDIRIEGTVPELIQRAQELLREEIGTVIRLTGNGRFGKVPALPEFAWLEAVVNAVTHRSYSLQGDGIHVRQFSDRLEIQSPGRLPGLVRVQNIQNARFSRNPHIARVLAEMTDYVRELNEGVKRMFEEMKQMGLRDPEYRVTDSHVCVILHKHVSTPPEAATLTRSNLGGASQLKIITGIDLKVLSILFNLFQNKGKVSTAAIAKELGVASPTARNSLKSLNQQGLVELMAKSTNDPRAGWVLTNQPLWDSLLSRSKEQGEPE